MEDEIHKITLYHTSVYRKKSLEKYGKYEQEPAKFRIELFDIYSKLNKTDIKKIIELLNI
jgi:hypothetical protein